MLTEISIENLGVIESVQLSLRDGFTVFTGETGAGKTMLVEAINLVVGRRADSIVVRNGAEEARVDARFTVDGEEVILTRVVSREGRSRAYVNGRMATVSALAEWGDKLVDIHGQHAHQRLLSPQAQRDALDVFAAVDLTDLHDARRQLVEIDAHLAALGGDEKTRAREIDLLQFQCEEIESAQLSDPAEDQVLAREEDELANVVKRREVSGALLEVLSGDTGALEALGVALKMAHDLGDEELGSRLASIVADGSDIAAELRQRIDSLEEDPQRLDEIRRRRQLFRDLQRKYGDSLSDVMEFGAEARARLDELNGYATRVEQLQRTRAQALARLDSCARKVGRERRAAAASLASSVEKRLARLAMPHARLFVSVGDEENDPAGDGVQFMLAANPGSEPLPLNKVASGGELARTMLAVRLVLAQSAETMVFDEVDAGIGGEAAVSVAQALAELGRANQVFAVTHLPQVAAAGTHHVAVEKVVRKGATFGMARSIEGTEREEEVARMLSGGIADDAARAHAAQLIASLRAGGPGASRSKRRT